MSSKLQTAGAATEKAREEKTVLTCGHCRSAVEEILLLDNTPQSHRKDMEVDLFVIHKKLLLQSCRR